MWFYEACRIFCYACIAIMALPIIAWGIGFVRHKVEKKD